MIFKILFLTFFTMNVLNAAIEEVRVGTIDNHYINNITKEKLRQILKEIEEELESQVGFDLFNYAISGKPIDIVFMPPLKLEKKIDSQIKKLNKKKIKIDNLRIFFPEEQKRINTYQESLTKFASHINEMTKSLNSYIETTNKRRDYTSAEYKNVQLFVNTKKSRIEREVKNLRKERRVLRRMIDSYNKKIYQMNRLVNEYNLLSNQIMRMNRSITKVKGKTFGIEEVLLKTYYKDGKKVEEKNITNSMTKIEIYGFETNEKLKAVLAHELMHLVGIPHINEQNALMHPILQDSQLQKLFLTEADIRNIKNNF